MLKNIWLYSPPPLTDPYLHSSIPPCILEKRTSTFHYPAGTYNLTAEALGYQTTSLPCTLQKGEGVTLTFQMIGEPLLMEMGATPHT
ncbi:MAG: carboxypeptidase regulatory-like domain-containing protein [Ignavibacteriae bacterium]|nr:carboxypeptidase regulatory-like domain-containing protein [Ignavibacteriota bacterium]MCB9217505.1 carboxypeptidase regulatory-like domain-containing protein [Ignavibacteria bacterium]